MVGSIGDGHVDHAGLPRWSCHDEAVRIGQHLAGGLNQRGPEVHREGLREVRAAQNHLRSAVERSVVGLDG